MESYTLNQSIKIINQCAHNIENKNEQRSQLIKILDTRKSFHPEAQKVITALISSCGLFPYLSDDEIKDDTLELITREFHKSKNIPEIYFHEEQLRVWGYLKNGENVILSAPTSFGKSLLIQEIVASRQHRNIVIIQPTLALLDETRKKLTKYSESYKVILSTKQIPSKDKGNIFLFTGERVVEYEHFPEINYFIVDEFYKLSIDREDDRAFVLNQAFYKLKKTNAPFYLLGPAIDALTHQTHERVGARWIKSNFSTVTVDEVKVEIPSTAKNDERSLILFDLLLKLKEPTLIYCSSPDRATMLARFFYFYLTREARSKESSHSEILNLIEWIDEQIHEDWILSSCLHSNIGIHHGSLPRHISSSMVDLFNKGQIQFLFCTSTLIEGVNTSAKNIVLYDKKKGSTPIDSFDFQNIKGRSGRMNQYFTGRIYNFHTEPDQFEVMIDIPVVSQDNAPEEVLAFMDAADLTKDSAIKLRNKIGTNPLLVETIKLNPGISIDAQLALINELETDIQGYHAKLHWTGIPTYQNLFDSCDLIWKFLLNSKDNKANIRNSKQLTTVTKNYLNAKNIRYLIEKDFNSDYWKSKIQDDSERINHVVNSVLSIYRQWFDFKLPKLLNVLSNIQRFVFQSNNLSFGEYSYVAGLIENSFLDPKLLAIQEYDVPQSAIRKLIPIIPSNADTDEIMLLIKKLTKEQLIDLGLIEYEIGKVLRM
jgi:hypothetical protein